MSRRRAAWVSCLIGLLVFWGGPGFSDSFGQPLPPLVLRLPPPSGFAADSRHAGATTASSGRVVRDFASVHAGPGPEHSLVWRLYQGSQVALSGQPVGADSGVWWPVRLWNSADGWLEDAALSFEPFPPPPTPRSGGSSGPCRPGEDSGSGTRGQEEQPLHAPASVVAQTGLGRTPEDTGLDELAPGTSVLADSWALANDGRVRYRVTGEGVSGWAESGAVTLRAADPLRRLVDGRAIVEPLGGVGMWFVPDSREHGESAGQRIADAARANGLTHLYVEVATSPGGFWGARWLDELLPAADRVGLRVIGSVYVCLDDLLTDLELSLQVARYRTPEGLSLDGLTADIEEKLIAENVQAYGELLRHHVGDDYLLVATVYPPESWFAPRYPWPALAASWNAVAPMAYWRQMEGRALTPAEVFAYTQRNIDKVRALTGRPDLPVEMLGQLFEMGRPRLLGPDGPSAAEIEAAARAAREAGAVGISFFDWTRATPAHWQALGAFRW